ncbi:MAG TPA: hypothetical protein VHE35_20200 [Kofleriaceae bacterium]|nr:hypothetical protein [Kofleriaceae bacterium]
MIIKRSLTTVSLLALSLAAGCVDQPGTSDDYLFGLTADQILAAKHVSQTQLTDAQWLDAHRGPFDCARYGDLCRAIGPDRAYHVIEVGYLVAVDGGDRAAVHAAQEEAIAAAKQEAAGDPSPSEAFYNSNTGFFDGGSGNKRLKITANAEKMWPSGELRADGECVFQKDVFGWQPFQADNINGSRSANFDGAISNQNLNLNNVQRLDFASVQIDAVHLTTTVTCAASSGTWSANGQVQSSVSA